MSKLIKAASAIYAIGFLLLAVLLPVGGIMVLAKLVGAAMPWAVACIPFFIALGIAAPVLVAKVLITLAGGGGNE